MMDHHHHLFSPIRKVKSKTILQCSVRKNSLKNTKLHGLSGKTGGPLFHFV